MLTMQRLCLLGLGLMLLSCYTDAQDATDPDVGTDNGTLPDGSTDDTVTDGGTNVTEPNGGSNDTNTDGVTDPDGDTEPSTKPDDDSGESTVADDEIDYDEWTFFATPCSNGNNTECTEVHANSECRTNGNSTNCGCPANSIIKDNNCIYQIKLNEICQDENSECILTNCLCKYDSFGEGIKRCLCKPGYLGMKDNGTEICATILTKDKVPDCEICEDNEGVCYGLNDKDKAGCKCPVSKIGIDCNETLVQVKCDVANFSMHICYTPKHEAVDFTRELAASSLHTLGKGDDESCIGSLLLNDTNFCMAGQVELILPLTAGEMERCNVKQYIPDRFTRKYIAEIEVSKGGSGDGQLTFETFCSFTKQTQSTFNGVAINVQDGNSRGEHLAAIFKFEIRDLLNRVIPEGVAILLGDSVKYRAEIELDGTYTAIRVERCTASSSPILPDPKAATELLILGSCPVSDSRVFTDSTNFKQVANQRNVLETGYFKIFKMVKGSSMFMHCTIKVCLSGNEADCEPVNCGDHNGAGRRKRRETEEENESYNIVRGVDIYEQPTGSSLTISKTDFAVLITILVLLLVFFIVLAVILFLKIRNRGQKVEDFGLTQKPQRFALPRIRTPNMRM